MSRAVAVLGAAALVLAAVWARGLIDDGGTDGGDTSSGDGTLTVVCGTPLADACTLLDGDDVEVRIEDEADTVERLSSGELTLDEDTVWLEAGPWPEQAEAAGADLPDVAASAVLARSPAVVVGRADRMEAIARSCGTITWACIGEQAGDPWTELGGQPTWGLVKVGLPSVDNGAGLVVAAQAVASRLGTTSYAANDIDADPETGAWLGRLASRAAAAEGPGTPLGRFLRLPGSLGVVATLESEAISLLSTAAGAADLVVVAPEPVATADVRLLAGDDGDVETALDRLGRAEVDRALSDTGWRVDGRPPQGADGNIGSTATALPEDSGLPAPGVVAAVIGRWKDAG